MKADYIFFFRSLLLECELEGRTFIDVYRLPGEGMCRYFSETPWTLPCGLCQNIHVLEARSRICTGWFTRKFSLRLELFGAASNLEMPQSLLEHIAILFTHIYSKQLF